MGLRGEDLLDSAGILVQSDDQRTEGRLPSSGSRFSASSALSSAASRSARRTPGDKRFTDPTWTNSALHSGLLKAYLAWGDAVEDFVDQTSLSDVDKQRASLFTTILIDAFAPTNTLIANPAAMRKLLDTGGQSIWQGLKNYLEDLAQEWRLPSQVDTSAFKVGENSATTPGSVVFRNELIELIQYAPTTADVRKRPLVITPPQINKYLCDSTFRRTKAWSGSCSTAASRLRRQLAQPDGRKSRLGARYLCRRARRSRRRGSRNRRQRRHIHDGVLLRRHHLGRLPCASSARQGAEDQEPGARGLHARHQLGRPTARSAR